MSSAVLCRLSSSAGCSCSARGPRSGPLPASATLPRGRACAARSRTSALRHIRCAAQAKAKETESSGEGGEGLAEFDDDDLSWADDIDDWDEFWAEDDPYLDKYGLGVVRQGDEVGARVVEPTERARLVYEKLEQLRAKPNFVGLEPFAAQDASVADINPIKPAPLPELPDLTPWDLRARMEKRRQQELQRLDWARRKSLIGLFPSLDMTGDLRLKPLPSEADREEREWTEEEIWRLITLDGKAVDPRAPGQVAKVLRVYDPEAQSDHPAEGYVEPPSTEEFLESIGRLMEVDELDLEEVETTFADASLGEMFEDEEEGETEEE